MSNNYFKLIIKPTKILHTKFGNAHLDNGYYRIITRKEGNHHKSLHRLIYEDFWGIKLPKTIHIHHNDENKLNNCICNLKALTISEHSSLHNTGENNPSYGKTGEKHHCYGTSLSKEHKSKISEKFKGEKNHQSKYTLWDISKVKYVKGNMCYGNRTPNPCKCFRLEYCHKRIPIGYFIDFLTPQIIYDLIEEELNTPLLYSDCSSQKISSRQCRP